MTTAFVFTDDTLAQEVELALREVGLDLSVEELKSSSRMDSHPNMRAARDAVLRLANLRTRIAVFVGPYHPRTIGKHCLQALQSVLLRNGLASLPMQAHFDEGIFPSVAEAERLHHLFGSLGNLVLHPREDSRKVFGIQVADVVAHSFGRIVRAEFTGERKVVEIGGPDTGYPEGATAPLEWSLLMSLRYALFTRPMAYLGHPYDPASDPVVLDPLHDDQVEYEQHPILIGWGVQVAPESNAESRCAVERALGRVWLGCIH